MVRAAFTSRDISLQGKRAGPRSFRDGNGAVTALRYSYLLRGTTFVAREAVRTHWDGKRLSQLLSSFGGEYTTACPDVHWRGLLPLRQPCPCSGQALRLRRPAPPIKSSRSASICRCRAPMPPMAFRRKTARR